MDQSSAEGPMIGWRRDVGPADCHDRPAIWSAACTSRPV